MVERFSRTMEEHLSKLVAEHRSAVQDTTGQTSARIVFERELRLTCDILFGSPSEDDLKEKLLSIHETLRHKIRVASDRRKTRYDLKGNSAGFQVGDLVWLYNPEEVKVVARSCHHTEKVHILS